MGRFTSESLDMLVEAYTDKMNRGEKVPFYDSEDESQRKQIGEVVSVWREDSAVKARVWLWTGHGLVLKIGEKDEHS